MNEVWIAVIVILLVFAYKGHRKGITGEVSSLISVALSVLGLALIVRMIGSYLEDNMSGIIQAVVFFVALAFLSQIFKFLFKSLKILTSVPVIHGINSFIGLIAGIAEGVLIIWALFIVIARYDIAGRSGQWLAMIANDPYLSLMSKLNPFARFFEI